MTSTILILFLVFFFTLSMSFCMLKFVKSSLFLDLPGARKIHTVSVPRFGGIAFGLISSLFILAVTSFSADYYWYYSSALLIFGIGIVDDMRTLSWKVKLSVQFIALAIIIVHFSTRVPDIMFFTYQATIPVYFVQGAFVIWFLGMGNSVNLIDGMDGLAGGAFLLMSLGASYIGWLSGNTQFMMIYLIVAVSLLAFLVFNGRPAKFFMGDGGSLFLGYHLAIMPLLFLSDSLRNSVEYLDLTPFILLSSFFFVDTMRVFILRIKRKQNPLTPDNSHFHHLLLESSLSYNSTLLVIFFFVAMSSVVAILQYHFQLSAFVMNLYLVFLVVAISIRYFLDSILSVIRRIVQGNRKLLKRLRKLISKNQEKKIKITLFIYFSLISSFVLFNLLLLQDWNTVFIYLLLALLVVISVFKSSLAAQYKVILMLGYQYGLMTYIFEYSQLHVGYDLMFWLQLVLLFYLLWAATLFFMNRSLSFLLRFWKVKDLLILVSVLSMLILLCFGLELPFVWSSVWLLLELYIGYGIYRIVFR